MTVFAFITHPLQDERIVSVVGVGAAGIWTMCSGQASSISWHGRSFVTPLPNEGSDAVRSGQDPTLHALLQCYGAYLWLAKAACCQCRPCQVRSREAAVVQATITAEFSWHPGRVPPSTMPVGKLPRDVCLPTTLEQRNDRPAALAMPLCKPHLPPAPVIAVRRTEQQLCVQASEPKGQVGDALMQTHTQLLCCTCTLSSSPR